MMKFLRKYQAWIMAVGGSLLMIAFLMPNALDMLGRMGVGRTIATYEVAGAVHKVKWGDYEEARRQAAFLSNASQRLYGLVPLPLDAIIPAPPNPDADPNEPPRSGFNGAPHWILLKEEARQAGFLGGRGEGEQVFQNWVAAQITAYDNDYDKAYVNARAQFVAVAGADGLTEREAYAAISDYLAVIRLIGLYNTLGVMSEPRLQHLAREMECSYSVAQLFLDAANFIDEMGEPAEQELLAHFEKYRATEPGAGEFGLGYRLPDRVKFECLRVSFESILDKVQVTGLEARNWYVRNGERLAAQLQMPNTPDFDDVRQQVIDEYRYEQAEEETRRIIDYVKGELLAARQGLEREGDYRILPEDWETQRPSFEAIREGVTAEFNVDADYTLYSDFWYTIGDLASVEGIGQAGRAVGSTSARFSDLAASLREFGDNAPIAGLQTGLADTSPLRDEMYRIGFGGRRKYPDDIYFYRIVEADAARPAATLDEVREEVVKDVKRLTAYQTLVENKEAWLKSAIDEDLQGLTEQVKTQPERLSARRYDRFSWRIGEGFIPPTMGKAGRSQDLIDAIFDKAEQFGPLDKIEDFERAERMVAVPIPDRLGLALVRIDRQTPLTKERFVNLALYGIRLSQAQMGVTLPQIDSMLTIDNEDHVANAFGWDALSERFAYTVESESEETDTPDSEGMGGSGEDDSTTDSETGAGNNESDG